MRWKGDWPWVQSMHCWVSLMNLDLATVEGCGETSRWVLFLRRNGPSLQQVSAVEQAKAKGCGLRIRGRQGASQEPIACLGPGQRPFTAASGIPWGCECVKKFEATASAHLPAAQVHLCPIQPRKCDVGVSVRSWRSLCCTVGKTAALKQDEKLATVLEAPPPSVLSSLESCAIRETWWKCIFFYT